MKNAKTMLRKILLMGAVITAMTVTGCKQPVKKDKGGEVKTFAVTVTQPLNGTITVKKGGELLNGAALKAVKENTELEITLTANGGYKAVKLVINGKPETNSAGGKTIVKKVKVTQALTVSGNVVQESTPLKTFAVTVTQPANGTISVKKSGELLNGAALKAVAENSEIEITLTANSGYKTVKLIVGDEEKTDSTDNGKTITKKVTVTKALSISGNVVQESTPLKTFAVTVTQPANGTISVKKGGELLNEADLKAVAENSEIEITLTANSGYKAVKLVVGDEEKTDSTDNGKTITKKVTVTKALTVSGEVVVKTEPKKYTVTFGVEGNSGGVLSLRCNGKEFPSGSTFNEGETLIFIASPYENFEVAEWEGIKATPENPAIAKVVINKNMKVTVKFSEKVPSKFVVTFGVDGTGGTLEAKVDGKKYESPIEIEKDKIIAFYAKPENGYEVESWTGDVESTKTGEEVKTLTVKKNSDIKVKFSKIKTDTVTVNFKVEGTGGYIMLGYNSKQYFKGPVQVKKGSDVGFAAVPDPGFQVGSWTGFSGPNTGKILVVVKNIQEDMTVTVRFVPE